MKKTVLKRFVLPIAVAGSAIVLATAGPAGAIQVDAGGEVRTVLDPAASRGPGEGLNPAHGPICAVLPSPCDGGVTNANPGIAPPGLAGTFLGVNTGAWNAFFVSNDNSAICGVNEIEFTCEP